MYGHVSFRGFYIFNSWNHFFPTSYVLVEKKSQEEKRLRAEEAMKLAAKRKADVRMLSHVEGRVFFPHHQGMIYLQLPWKNKKQMYI